MPLKITMEPQEWLMIGNTRVVNAYFDTATLTIEGAAPVLRQAHTMDAEAADTPAKCVYLAVQRLYLGFTEDIAEYQRAASELLRKDPSCKEAVLKANVQMSKGSLYGALREYRKLIAP